MMRAVPYAPYLEIQSYHDTTPNTLPVNILSYVLNNPSC